MSYLNHNIKYLRKERAYTQGVLAQKIDIKRSLIGAYEECRAEPKIATIQKLSYLFGVSLDDLINSDLSKEAPSKHVDMEGKTLRVLPIAVDQFQREKITAVPVKAEAGYSERYADPEYISELPSFSLPLEELFQDQTTRLFQISGDSMLPILPGSYMISSYVENWDHIKDGETYIIVTKDQGVVYKRAYKQLEKSNLLLKSDNVIYEPFEVSLEEVLEVWKAEGSISFDLPSSKNDADTQLEQLTKMVLQLQQDMNGIKKNIHPKK